MVTFSLPGPRVLKDSCLPNNQCLCITCLSPPFLFIGCECHSEFLMVMLREIGSETTPSWSFSTKSKETCSFACALSSFLMRGSVYDVRVFDNFDLMQGIQDAELRG